MCTVGKLGLILTCARGQPLSWIPMFWVISFQCKRCNEGGRTLGTLKTCVLPFQISCKAVRMQGGASRCVGLQRIPTQAMAGPDNHAGACERTTL